MNSDTPLIVNDWTIYAHPLFLDQLETLIGQVERHSGRQGRVYRRPSPARTDPETGDDEVRGRRIAAEHEAGLTTW